MIYVAIFLFFISGCISAPPAKVIDPYTPAVCVLSTHDGQCWVDKGGGKGTTIDKMEGWFCESPQDLDDMIGRMRQDGDVNGAANLNRVY